MNNNYPNDTQMAVNLAIGFGTTRQWFIAATTKNTADTFFKLEILEDTVFTALTDGELDLIAGAGTILAGKTILAGTTLYGQYSGVELTSGTIMGYIRIPRSIG